VSQPDPGYRWFGRHWVWVYPASRDEEVRALIAAGRKKYDDQPDWNLNELKPQSPDEVEAPLTEFNIASHEASVTFDWMTNYTSHEKGTLEAWNISRNGWKHVSLRDLLSKVDDIYAPRGKSLLRQTAFAGQSSEKKFRKLLADAAEQKPAAVARLWHQCKNEQTLRKVLAELYELSITPTEIEEIVQTIPNPVALGT
jgi:hypothetical protein